MGEAKRKRAVASTSRKIETCNPATGETTMSRLTCSPYEFVEELADISARNAAGKSASSRTPCNGCRECCWYFKVEVDPLKENPSDLRRLDLVQDLSGSGLVLRKNEDGSCVHLGEQGCTVYAHRPKACRVYDCRISAVVGLVESYDNGHRAPVWYFKPKSDEESAVFHILATEVTKEVASNPKRDSREIARKALSLIPEVQRQVADFGSDPRMKAVLAELMALPEEEKVRFSKEFLISAAIPRSPVSAG